MSKEEYNPKLKAIDQSGVSREKKGFPSRAANQTISNHVSNFGLRWKKSASTIVLVVLVANFERKHCIMLIQYLLVKFDL